MQTLLRLVRLCGSEALGECRYFWGLTAKQNSTLRPYACVRSTHTARRIHRSLRDTMPLNARLALTATLLLALSSVMVTSAGTSACCELWSPAFVAWCSVLGLSYLCASLCVESANG